MIRCLCTGTDTGCSSYQLNTAWMQNLAEGSQLSNYPERPQSVGEGGYRETREKRTENTCFIMIYTSMFMVVYFVAKRAVYEMLLED